MLGLNRFWKVISTETFSEKKYIWENQFFSEINNRFLRIFCVHIYNTVTWHYRMMPYLSLFTTLNFHKNHSHHFLYRCNQLRLVRGRVVKPLLYCSANTAFFWPISVVYVVLLINLRSPSKEVRFSLCESLLNWTWVLSSLPASSSKTPNKDRPPPPSYLTQSASAVIYDTSFSSHVKSPKLSLIVKTYKSGVPFELRWL